MSALVSVRASSVPGMFDCAMRWQAIHLEGRRVPTTLNAVLGRAVHKGTAVFDVERVAGLPGNVSAAMDAAAETVEKPDEDIALTDTDKPAQAKDVAVSLVEKYATDFAPTRHYVGVEIGVPALDVTDLGITLTGTADRVRLTDDGPGICDLKTGKTIVDARGVVAVSGHASQIGVYELLAEAALGRRMTADAEVIGLQTNITREKQRIATGLVQNAREVLTGTQDAGGLLPVMARIAHGELTWGNPRSFMCHERFCPAFKTCFYRR